MPLKNEERVGRRKGTKGSQLFRSDHGSFTFKQSDSPKPSKFLIFIEKDLKDTFNYSLLNG